MPKLILERHILPRLKRNSLVSACLAPRANNLFACLFPCYVSLIRPASFVVPDPVRSTVYYQSKSYSEPDVVGAGSASTWQVSSWNLNIGMESPQSKHAVKRDPGSFTGHLRDCRLRGGPGMSELGNASGAALELSLPLPNSEQRARASEIHISRTSHQTCPRTDTAANNQGKRAGHEINRVPSCSTMSR